MGVSISVHPEAGEITARRVPSRLGDFGVLDIGPDLAVYVAYRSILDALQAALDEIRADMDAGQEPAGDNPWDSPYAREARGNR